MAKKVLILMVLAGFSLPSLAASPFLVRHDSIDSNGGQPANATPVTNTKSTTLAQSLVHLRNCHDNNAAAQSKTDSESASTDNANSTGN